MTAHSISILSELKMTSFGPYAGLKMRSPSADSRAILVLEIILVEFLYYSCYYSWR